MSGWNLTEGLCNNECKNENDFWLIINNVLSNKTNKTTSYKYGFFKALLDNIFNVNENNEIDYKTIFERFAEIYWNLVIKYELCQIQATSSFSKSSVEIILENIFKKYPLEKEIPFECLNDEVKSEVIKAVTRDCSKYVVGAFYADTNCSFYSFNRKLEIIKLAPNIIEYLIKYKNILGKLNYFEWIKFLEKTNANNKVFSLAEKLDNSSKRGNLSYYKDFLKEIYGEYNCFYCGKNLNTMKIEMDHFIPWSYIKDDKMWNMVISCRDCNNNKRDKLPDKVFISKLIEQNKKIIQGPYYNSIQREYMGYSDENLIKIYNSATFNGFNENWKPKGGN